MSGAVGSGYAAEQPQCYNCGAPGHWAVACPEPTRQTPAGLAAWRSSSHAHFNGTGGNRDRRGAPKKHKGPIITKYGPPPGQQHPQPPPPPPGGNSYAPPGYHGHAPYHSSGPPLPSHQPPPSGYHHYPPPPPGYPPQPPPDYAPQQYGHATSQYPPTPPGPPQAPPPPPPYHYDTQPAYGYGQQPQLPPPPPPLHYHQPPPIHRPYPEPEHERRRHQSSPPPPPPGYGPPASAQGPHGSHRGRKGVHSSGSHSRQHSQGHRRNERNQAQHHSSHTPKKNSGQQSRGPTQTSGPISLPAPLMHSLPPKPPQSKHSQPEQVPKGKNNKRKQDRQNRQKGNKQRQRDRSRDRKEPAQELPEESEQADRPPSRSTLSTETQGVEKKATGDDKAGSNDAVAAKSISPQEPVSSVPETSAAKDVDSPTRPASPAPEVDEWTWEFSHIFKTPDAVHEPDEIGRPLPFSYNDDILLPRKWNAECIASEFVSPGNLELYIRPVHETHYWPHIEFDPAFVVEGKFPCGESIPQHLLTGEAPPEVEATAPSLREGHSRKRSLTESADEDRSNKRHRPSEDRRVDSYVPSRHGDGRTRTRSRSRQRRSETRSPPPRSRRSSASSLNSLEAELLGISETHESPETGTPRRPTSSGRRDDSRSPQTQRRRPRTDSAYSRRW
ncbi:zinc knuckle domain-containing protein [Sarocladium implicatum]|nr:zinc knuckle domain-containing protein [Sarocladium implicatum]